MTNHTVTVTVVHRYSQLSDRQRTWFVCHYITYLRCSLGNAYTTRLVLLRKNAPPATRILDQWKQM